jgi:hypothetical protein
MVDTTLDAAPAEVVAAIDRFVTRSRRERTTVDPFPLGILWGDAVARAVGWKWRELVRGDARALAIATPDHTIACDVVDMFRRQLERRDTTIVLLFNMIVADKLPETRAGRVVTIG